MIIRAIKKYQNVVIKSLYKASIINSPQYTPPPSKFEEFKKNLESFDNEDSRKEAAELLARL
jgi:hypothetical protein